MTPIDPNDRSPRGRRAMGVVALSVVVLLGVPMLWVAPVRLRNLNAADAGLATSAVVAYLWGWLWLRRLTIMPTGCAGPSLKCAVILATFGTWFIAALAARTWLPSLLPADTSLFVIVTTSVVGCLLLLMVALGLSSRVLTLLLAVVIVAVGAIHILYREGWLPRPPQPTIDTRFIDSSLYRLQLTTYSNWLPFSQEGGGGITPWADGMLVSSGTGKLAIVRGLDERGPLRVTALPYPVPINTTDFLQGATAVLAHLPGSYADVHRFRVADLLTVDSGATVTIYASHHYWDVDNSCFVLRVSALTADRAQLEAGTAKAAWRTVYQTAPCLTLNTVGPRGAPFEGWENGGRLRLLNSNELLLTVGDHGFDGLNRKPALSQDQTSSYGKIWRIPLDGSTPVRVSMGHRNPQGLLVGADGTIWETEHGPRGGDELNRIVPGANYGWPLETLGTDYGDRNWPLDSTPGRHDGFVGPVFAFVPSVGISNLIAAPASSFPEWAGDLLVGSLVRQTIFRVRLHDGAVQFVEPINVGNRVRDMATTPHGAVVIWSDDGRIMVLSHTDETAAERLIAVCSGCHATNSDQPSFTGPSLYGVVNRRVASLDDFNYSPAMKAEGGRWTRERLDRFLANPQSEVRGTTMAFGGIPSSQDRQAIIEFLQNRPQD